GNVEQSQNWSTHFQLARLESHCYSAHLLIRSWSHRSSVTPRFSDQSSRSVVVQQQHLIELCVGETLQVGQFKVTLLVIDGEELCVQIDGRDDDGIDSCELGLEELLEVGSL